MTQARTRPIPPLGQVLGLALGLVLPTLLSWLYFDLLAAHSAALQQGVYAAGKIIQFSLPLLLVFFVAPEPTGPLRVRSKALGLRAWGPRVRAWGKQGLPEGPREGREGLRVGPKGLRGRSRGLWVGLPFGAIVMAVIVFAVARGPWPGLPLEALEEAVRTKVTGIGIATPLRYAMVGIFYTIAHSFLEEYYFRWFLFGRLRCIMPLPAAIALSSVGFAAHHALLLSVFLDWQHPLTWLLSALIAVGGAVWAWIYERSGSLLAPWLSHALVDAGIFIAGYSLLGSF